ncbi:MAG TPA: nickel-dependent lactate racemase [Candidatus Lachnoclostridium pullistercoris]|uniref:Nickel-dependent lactate racemase n=1 Tax=Candidatus Lachnoclostridium pullistercoris TaxID=2838632 RepID=A0A9D2PC58_9FIRM|nr:nickel-dependent lactate racemase [Candidatus Lachnoclostridium pullistercoris]
MKVVKGGKVSELLRDTKIPKMFRARQIFSREMIRPEEIPAAVHREMEKENIGSRIRPGMSVAVTAGSRGIRNVDIITKAVVDEVKARGASPFIVPAMGSHGGATEEGQLAMLAGYGITPESMGCPIRSSMEVVELGYSERGRRVVLDKNAYEADGIIISCRLKPHNAFRGPYESGPCKMMTVGLGKQVGASIVHGDGMDVIAQNIPTMAKVVLEKANILFAIPCIENAYDETCRIEAIPAENILEREPELLKYAFSNMPRLIVGEADVLVVDEVGKNYSGTGVDPNITGTFSTPYASGGLKVQRTCFLNLSKESHGNALGCGLASAITRKIFDDMDIEQMYPNCITSTVLASARIPCVVSTDKEAVQICIKTCNKIDQDHVRVVRIPNSLHIGSIMLSEAYYEDVKAGKYPGLEAVDEPKELEFDGDGNVITKIEQG